MSEWVKCLDRLPDHGNFVVVHYVGTNWGDLNDAKGARSLVAKLVRGLSLAERATMRDSDNAPTKRTWCRADGWQEHFRWELWEAGDERDEVGSVPYVWQTTTAQHFCAASIDKWAPLPGERAE